MSSTNPSAPERAADAALAYLDRGWHPIALQPRSKQALEPWKDYQERQPTRGEVEAWFAKCPDANVGLVTGRASGIVALDFDGEEGAVSAEQFREHLETVTSLTPRGFHKLFKHPGGDQRIRTRAGILRGVDVRADGGYIVAPPSVHPGGDRYRWAGADEQMPWEPLAPLPDTLLELLGGGGESTVFEGHRNDAIARLAGSCMGRGLGEAEALRECVEFNERSCRPPLSQDEVRNVVVSIARGERAHHETRKGCQLIRLSDVRPEPVEWLWPGYFPRGKVIVLDGDPGVGKSAMTLDIAARLTTGRLMPDGSKAPRCGAVVINAEDGLADTIVPRLAAMGADRTRIVTPLVESTCPRIPHDLGIVKEAARSVGAGLIIVDPLMAMLPRSINSWSDQHVRTALVPLKGLAEELDATVVLVRHLTKGRDRTVLERGGGSIGITGAARMAFVVGHHPEHDEMSVLAPVKTNLAARPPALMFRLESADGAVRVAWAGPTTLSADDLFQSLPRDSALEDAIGFLEEALAAGEAASADLEARAEAAGISRRTLRRAKEKRGVTARRDGFGAGSRWVVTLPPKVAEDDE